MSRCFPFPPPGYEKQARTDDLDLLTKDKHKEKKHKKEKDKKNREGKEKKDRDRSKEKHKDKKVRKEKHKDKDKEKDKDTEKNENKLKRDSALNNLPNYEEKDSKYLQELARRINDEHKASGSQMVHSLSAANQRGAETFGKRMEPIIAKQSVEREKVGDQANRKTNGQRNHDDVRGFEKAFGVPLQIMDKGRVEGNPRSVEKAADKQIEGKDKSKSKESNGQSDKHRSKDKDKDRDKKSRDKESRKEKEAKVMEMGDSIKKEAKLGETSPNLKGNIRYSPDFRNGHVADLSRLSGQGLTKVKEMVNPMKKEAKLGEARVHLKGNTRDLLDFRNGQTTDVLNLSSPGSAKAKEMANIVKKEAQLGEMCLHSKGNIRNPLNIRNGRVTDVSKLSSRGFASESNLGKRKEFEMNGFILDNGARPSKLQKPVSFPAVVIGNGRRVEPCQNSIWFAPDKTNIDIPDCKINGIVVAQRSNFSMYDSTTLSANRNGNVSLNTPPHPDCKYLSQILCVPALEELTTCESEDWLFGGTSPSKKKSEGDSGEMDEQQQVWADAVRIESADISALPYVIPY